MSKVYLQKSLGRDTHIGRVDSDGKVYQKTDRQSQLDRYIGRVDLSNGKIYAAEKIPENLIGRVEADGKVYRSALGPDDYLGQVKDDGKFYRHQSLSPDDYIGSLESPGDRLLGAAAFLLLVYPAWKESQG